MTTQTDQQQMPVQLVELTARNRRCGIHSMRQLSICTTALYS